MIDGNRADAGTNSCSRLRRTCRDSSCTDAPSMYIASKKNARRPPPRPAEPSAPKSPIVSWNRRGDADARSPTAAAGAPASSPMSPSTSPSSTRSAPGNDRTSSTTPGRRSVMSFRLRVNSDTTPPLRCACTRAPSSFHSTEANPISSTASPALAAGLANIGCTGRPGWSRTAASAGPPPVSAACAAAPRSPAIIAARRTDATGTSAALATAVSTTPSSAPWRSSPPRMPRKSCCSRSVAALSRSSSASRRAATAPVPDTSATLESAAAT